MKLGTTLYIKNTVEAVGFYQEAFGLTLGYYEVYLDGTFMHAELHKDGKEVFAVSESMNDILVNLMLASDLKHARPTMCFGISFESEEEVKKAFDMLSKNGTILLPLGSLPWSPCCAEVVDQYGVYWYLHVS
jgi:uncharacterized glyoxalase superfamily protein PhnB